MEGQAVVDRTLSRDVTEVAETMDDLKHEAWGMRHEAKLEV